MAVRKRRTRSRKARTSVKRRRRATVSANPKRSFLTRRRRRRSNPVVARSRRRRTSYASRRRRHRNPLGGGLFKEAFDFTAAGFGVVIAAPLVQRLVGGFLPLGQFQQPVVIAATGFGLSWLAGFVGFARPYQKPLKIMGISLGLTALLTPYVRKFFAGADLGSAQGLSGHRNMRGIGMWTNIPPYISAPPAPAATGMNGIGALPGLQGRFGR